MEAATPETLKTTILAKLEVLPEVLEAVLLGKLEAARMLEAFRKLTIYWSGSASTRVDRQVVAQSGQT